MSQSTLSGQGIWVDAEGTLDSPPARLHAIVVVVRPSGGLCILHRPPGLDVERPAACLSFPLGRLQNPSCDLAESDAGAVGSRCRRRDHHFVSPSARKVRLCCRLAPFHPSSIR